MLSSASCWHSLHIALGDLEGVSLSSVSFSFPSVTVLGLFSCCIGDWYTDVWCTHVPHAHLLFQVPSSLPCLDLTVIHFLVYTPVGFHMSFCDLSFSCILEFHGNLKRKYSGYWNQQNNFTSLTLGIAEHSSHGLAPSHIWEETVGLKAIDKCQKMEKMQPLFLFILVSSTNKQRTC